MQSKVPGPTPGGGDGTGQLRHATWGDTLNVRAQPNTGAVVVTSLPGSTSVLISCEAHAQYVLQHLYARGHRTPRRTTPSSPKESSCRFV
ncbi:hypothetical protein [Streptomyces sp. G-G2]|uniref:hypothetical protein n=1 Tax=Streptomyces sp. G-G2 TaxID=3046201 RepID=UPI0024BA25B6|nr:hypothetical protein [Streptomyces sp. G-G2]MDJ0380348.1 hypothetical protein [Streptomyces sp. G-G2]